MPNAITIQGHKFDVPDAVLAKFEAFVHPEAPAGLKSMVRQVIAENLRNNFATKVKAAQTNGELTAEQLDGLQADFARYADGYEPGVRSSSGATRVVRDPVEREMLKLAREDISRAYMAKYNEKVDKDMLAEKATQLLELPGKGDTYRRRANTIINQRQKAGSDDLESLGL